MKKLLLLFLFSQSLLYGQQFREVDSVFNILNNMKVLNTSVISGYLIKFQTKNKIQLIEIDQRFIDLAAKSGNRYLYAYFLFNSAWLQDFPIQRKILSEAFSIAKQNNYFDLMGIIDETRGIYFKQNSMFDSAMTY